MKLAFKCEIFMALKGPRHVLNVCLGNERQTKTFLSDVQSYSFSWKCWRNIITIIWWQNKRWMELIFSWKRIQFKVSANVVISSWQKHTWVIFKDFYLLSSFMRIFYTYFYGNNFIIPMSVDENPVSIVKTTQLLLMCGYCLFLPIFV